MNLALEQLGVVQPKRTIVDDLIDQINLTETEDALLDSLEEVDMLLHTCRSLESIHQAIKQYGVTQSIAYLYGENFSSMENDQTDGAEKEVDEKKQGVLRRVWEAIKNLIKKFIEWLGGLFTSVKSIKSKLTEAQKKTNNCNYPFSVVVLSLRTMDSVTTYMERLSGAIIMGATKDSTDQNFAAIRKDLESDLNSSNEAKVTSAQIAANACENHVYFFDTLDDLKKGFEKALSQVSKNASIAKEFGIDLGGTVSQYKDSIALCKDIIKANITSSRNLIAAINKAQK